MNRLKASIVCLLQSSPGYRLDWVTIIEELDRTGFEWVGTPSPWAKMNRVTCVLARRRNPFVHVSLKTYQWDPYKHIPVRVVRKAEFSMGFKLPATRGVVIHTWAQSFYFQCSKRHTFQSIINGFYNESGIQPSFYKSFFDGIVPINPLTRLEKLTESILHVIYCECDEDGLRYVQ